MKSKIFLSFFFFTIFFNLLIINYSRAHENDNYFDESFVKKSLSKSKIIDKKVRGKAKKGNYLCTKLVKKYNEDRNVDIQRLNYLVSHKESIETILDNISLRNDNFQHQAYKKGCITLDGTPTPKVTLKTKNKYERLLKINIEKILNNEYQ